MCMTTMEADRFKVVIRGHGGADNMSVLCERLEQEGFVVLVDIDGSSDSLGGIIETGLLDENEMVSDAEGLYEALEATGIACEIEVNRFRAETVKRPKAPGFGIVIE
jgi:hypothetical protein